MKTPMLCTLIDAPFDSREWLFETKWDGFRAIGAKSKKVELISRKVKSFNDRFPGLVADLQKLPGRFVVDGEIVILDKHGRSRFQLLQNYQRRKVGTPYYFLFDILSYNGRDLHDLPLLDRKKILKKLLTAARRSHLRYSDHIIGKGKALFREAVRKKWEGIVAKKCDSPYEFRRSRNWLKIKTKLRQEVVIGGFTAPQKSRIGFGALLLGVYEKGKLVFVGHVGTGFDEKTLEDLSRRLKKLAVSRCPFERSAIIECARHLGQAAACLRSLICRMDARQNHAHPRF